MKKTIDAPFLFALCLLVVAGLLIFTSAALSLLAQDGGATFTSVAIKQVLLGLVLGGGLMVFFARTDYRIWKAYTPYIFGAAIILCILPYVPHVGLHLKGAARWIVIGPLSFQPSEAMKFATVLFLAAIYAARMKAVGTIKGGILPLALIAGSASLLVLVQPDTASAAIIGMSAIAVLFAAGGKVSHLLILFMIGMLAIGGAALKYQHVADRIKTFIHQEADPLGAGYQIQQSLIAVGSGQFTGKGFGQSLEKFSYLPEPIGDSIFAVAGEEFGFVGSSLLVLLYMTIAILGLRIAARAQDPFGGLVAVGLTVIIVGQSFFHIASTLALVPLVGVPLVFVSHGGTSLAISLAEVGMILSVSRRMKEHKEK
jgi:cell division protein FtsW